MSDHGGQIPNGNSFAETMTRGHISIVHAELKRVLPVQSVVSSKCTVDGNEAAVEEYNDRVQR